MVIAHPPPARHSRARRVDGTLRVEHAKHLGEIGPGPTGGSHVLRGLGTADRLAQARRRSHPTAAHLANAAGDQQVGQRRVIHAERLGQRESRARKHVALRRAAEVLQHREMLQGAHRVGVRVGLQDGERVTQ